MQKWHTEEIRRMLEEMPGVSVTTNPPGGNHDTTMIIVIKEEARCMVFGMTDNPIEDSANPSSSIDEVGIDHLFACHSAKNGMINAGPADMILCGEVAAVLVHNGFTPDNGGWKLYF
jgi:hypothetical protein